MSAYIYLLHFDRPYPGGRHPQHYLGVCADISRRLGEHHAGSSKSRLTRACKERGITLALARVWRKRYPKAAFDHERQMKQKKKSYTRLCPLCAGKPARGLQYLRLSPTCGSIAG